MIKPFLKSLLGAFFLGEMLLLPTGAGAATLNIDIAASGQITVFNNRSSQAAYYFNVQGSSHGRFASYGVLDFDLPVLPAADSLSESKLVLAQSLASFTTDGDVGVYLSRELAVSNPRYQAGKVGREAVGSAFGDLIKLSDYFFWADSDGYDDAIALFQGPAEAYLLSLLGSGGTLRLLVVPESASVAATWAGRYHDYLYEPRLELTITDTPIPEPEANLGILLLCGLGILGARRKL